MEDPPPPFEAVYILKGGRRLGPFTLDELLDGLEDGIFSENEVCLREGAAHCERLRDLLDWDAETTDEDESEDLCDEDEEESGGGAPDRGGETPVSPRRRAEPDRIVYSGHPSVLTCPFALGALVGGVFGGFWLYRLDANLTLAAFALALVGLVRLSYVRFTHDYRIRRRRVEIVTGLLARSSREVRIEDIRSINVACRGVSGLFGIGTVDFLTSGDAPEISFRKVWAARRVKGLVRRLQDAP